MLTFLCWKWNQKIGKIQFRETYTAHHVNMLVNETCNDLIKLIALRIFKGDNHLVNSMGP